MHDSNALLTASEHQQLATPEHIDIGQYRGRGRQSFDFKVSIDALPLAVLIDTAAAGQRVYELMALHRPGDVLHYLWVEPESVGPEVAALIQQLQERAELSINASDGAAGMPLMQFDWLFRWEGDDTASYAESWLLHREKVCWGELCSGLLAIAVQAQSRLRASPDFLIQREIALIDRHQHRRDYWPGIERKAIRGAAERENNTISQALRQTILQLAERADVRSISCPFDEPALWRALIEIQVRRAESLGVAPQQALRLSGPDSGLGDVSPEDCGGKIHIPYEGAAPGDLFIQPSWRELRLEADQDDGSLTQVNGGTPCHLLLVEKDYGELACASRKLVDGWVLYESRRPYRPAYVEHWSTDETAHCLGE